MPSGDEALDVSAVEHLAHVIQFALGMIFLAALIGKLRSPRRFLHAVTGYRLLPYWLTKAAAIAVVAAELFLAAAFLSGWLIGPAALLALPTLGAFSLAVGINLHRGRRVACGCFGNRSEQISGQVLTRLIALLSMAILLVSLEFLVGTPPLTLSRLVTSGQQGFAYGVDVLAAVSFLIVGTVWLLHSQELAVVARGGRPRASLSQLEVGGDRRV